MPEMNGFRFLDELRGNPSWRGVPVIVVTARELTDGDRERLRAMAQGVVTKRGNTQAEVTRAIRALAMPAAAERPEA
jgi:CheY-like chemotaxis protein